MARESLGPILLLTCLVSAVGFPEIGKSLTNPSRHLIQPTNLLQNPNADGGSQSWQKRGEATIEEAAPGDPCFVVRNHGSFSQGIALREAMGQYVLLIGRVSSERINPDGAITGLPYLYGMMLNEDGKRINAYLQGQQMLCSAKTANEWVPAWGIFEVPAATSRLLFSLSQAERQGVPQNGSAAKFDDLGLHLFPAKEEAMAFVDQYLQQKK